MQKRFELAHLWVRRISNKKPYAHYVMNFPTSHLYCLIGLANTEGHPPKKSCLEVGRPMTGQLSSPKAPYPPAVYTSPVTRGPRIASKLVQGKPNLAATSNAKVFQKKILLALGKNLHIILYI